MTEKTTKQPRRSCGVHRRRQMSHFMMHFFGGVGLCHSEFLIPSVEDLTGTFLFLFPLSLRMDCYNSSDPAAVNATIVYDFHVHHRDFWSRNIEDVQDQPLLHCSSTDLPRETQCTVCLDHVVYAVCRKLKDRVVLTMEALQHPIKISKSGKKLSHSCSRHPGGFRAVAVHVTLRC